MTILSTEKKYPLKRDQALKDATNDQFGEELPDTPKDHSKLQADENLRKKVARKLSKNIN